MTGSRLLKVLLSITGLLACAVLAYFISQRPRLKAPFARATDAAKDILLQQDAAKVELTLQDRVWTVAGGGGYHYKADQNKVKSLLAGLHDLRVEDEISDRLDRMAEFEVNPESGTRVTLSDKGGARLADAIFGKQAPDFAHIYYRAPDKPGVYLARGLSRGDLGEATVKDWRSRELLDVAEDRVLAIRIVGPGYKTALKRSSDTWSCQGKLVEAAPVWALVGALAHLRADDFVDPAQPAGITADKLRYAQIAVQTPDAAHELHLGSPDPKTKRYPVSVDKEPSVAWIPEGTARSLLRRPADFRPLSSFPQKQNPPVPPFFKGGSKGGFGSPRPRG